MVVVVVVIVVGGGEQRIAFSSVPGIERYAFLIFLLLLLL